MTTTTAKTAKKKSEMKTLPELFADASTSNAGRGTPETISEASAGEVSRAGTVLRRGKKRRRPQLVAGGPPAGFKTASTLWSSIHHAAMAAMKAKAAHQKNGAL